MRILEPQSCNEGLDPILAYVKGFSLDSELMISNLKTEVLVADTAAGYRLPTTVNSEEYENSYVCSPYTAMIPYCREELGKLENKALRAFVSILLSTLDPVLKKRKINQVVHVNNWMLSTNLYPAGLCEDDLARLTEDLVIRFPHHSIAFRSLNKFTNQRLLDKLVDAGYRLIPSRQIYIYDKSIRDYSRTKDYKKDRKLLDNTVYQYVSQSQILPSDYDRIVELYNLLYIEKYSYWNPRFCKNFIRSIIENPYFYIEGFRNPEGELDAVGGRFTCDRTTTLPIVGYDTRKDISLGLYRMIVMSALVQAEENGMIFNASSGAPDFKRVRGAFPQIEYSAVYTQHLPGQRRRLWRVIEFVLRYLFVPVMQKYEL